MSDLAVTTPSTEGHNYREVFLKAFRSMLLARALEDKIGSLYQAGKIVGGVYTGNGQEAFSAGLTVHLKKGHDIFAPLIRDQAGRLAFGEPLEDAARTYFGSVLGPMRGRDGNIHRGRPQEGIPAMISHLGAMVSVVTGMLMARRFKGEQNTVGVTSIGDGGTSTGAFHEGLNLAAVEKLPLIISVANNQFAYSTPTDRQYACDHLIDRAIGYGVEGHTVDGTDLLSCIQTYDKAVRNARGGGGPQMVVGTLLRLGGHGQHDDGSYVSEALKQSPLGRDCIEVAEAQVREQGWMSDTEIQNLKTNTGERVQSVVASAQKEPTPDPYTETWQSLGTLHLSESRPNT